VRRLVVAGGVVPGPLGAGRVKERATFYTRPQLAGPIVRRPRWLRLCFDAEAGAETTGHAKPEQILALKVCDPAMGFWFISGIRAPLPDGRAFFKASTFTVASSKHGERWYVRPLRRWVAARRSLAGVAARTQGRRQTSTTSFAPVSNVMWSSVASTALILDALAVDLGPSQRFGSRRWTISSPSAFSITS